MKSVVSRRDFLKLAGLASLGILLPPSVQFLNKNTQNEKKNVLVIVFDALTAFNMSLYGYPRNTTPNLSKLAKRATVFHNHFASGNFTTPGTASLLTGTLPWTHRAIRFHGSVKEDFKNKSIFHAFEDYHRVAFSHNPLVHTLFKQFIADITEYIPQNEFNIINNEFIQSLFSKDEDIFNVGLSRTIKRTEGFSYSLFLSQVYEKYQSNKIANFSKAYPYGLPALNDDNYFTLEQGIDSVAARLSEIPKPFFGYFHFLPPHFPYRPRQEFAGTFTNDSYYPISKPEDLFSQNRTDDVLTRERAKYDEFILNIDYEFGRLFDHLESSGLLNDTWLVFTSDHGELFERGIWKHTTPTFYQPVVRVPLIIFEPGNQTGQAVYSPTSAIDLMPTLLHITGHETPTWAEGNVLPPFSTILNNHVIAVQARNNQANAPITELSAMLTQENYKLIYYQGYEELSADKERSLLFDILADPEELNNLSVTKKETANELLAIIKTKLEESNKPYL